MLGGGVWIEGVPRNRQMGADMVNPTSPNGDLRLGPEPASRLLRLAMQPAIQPADLLIEFALSQRDNSWVEEAFRRGGLGSVDAASDAAAERTERQLRAWRESAKRDFDSNADFRVRAGALVVYAWCVAESILRFGTSASTERRDAIDGLLGAAASIAPEGLRERLEGALVRETAD
ncbi:MAG: hypothetical protein ACK5WD_02890 [bacterium]|jgi:hypothetical protein